MAKCLPIALAAALGIGQGVVRPVIEQSAPAPDGAVTVTVRVPTPGMNVGAYQGTLRYAPGSLSILRATAPAGDGNRVVNPADSAQGIVRFAGFTVQPFKSDVVLMLVVRPREPISGERYRAQLEVLSDLDGSPMPRARLQPSDGVRSRP